MKKSSAYPVLFGQAVRRCLSLGQRFGGKSCNESQKAIHETAKELLAALPPEGQELPHVAYYYSIQN